MIKLICINDGVITKKNQYTGELIDQTGTGLKEDQEYTASDLAICCCGHLCYNIAELNNDIKLIERFREITYTVVSQREITTIKK